MVTRDAAFAARGVILAPNLDAALTVARGDASRRGVRDIMIIGGGELYRQTIARACRLEITRVHANPAGDSAFPASTRRSGAKPNGMNIPPVQTIKRRSRRSLMSASPRERASVRS